MSEQGTIRVDAAPARRTSDCVHLIDGKSFALPDGTPGSERYLMDLPTLPWMKDEARRIIREWWGWRWWFRQGEVLRFVKQRFYLDEKVYAFRETKRGILILRVWDWGDPAFLEYVHGIPQEVRETFIVAAVTKPLPDDPEATML